MRSPCANSCEQILYFLIFHLYFSFNTRPRLDFSCIFEKIIFKYIHLCYNVKFYAANPIAFGYGLIRKERKICLSLSVLGRLKSLMLSTARAILFAYERFSAIHDICWLMGAFKRASVERKILVSVSNSHAIKIFST